MVGSGGTKACTCLLDFAGKSSWPCRLPPLRPLPLVVAFPDALSDRSLPLEQLLGRVGGGERPSGQGNLQAAAVSSP